MLHTCAKTRTLTRAPLRFIWPVKSLLLKQLAEAAGGASFFGFIPDGSMNATVFNCALANLHTTCAADVALTLRLPDDAMASVRLVGGYGSASDAGGVLTARPGALQLGAPRRFLVTGLPAGGAERLQVELSYRVPGAPPSARVIVALPPVAATPRPLDAAACAAARLRLAGAAAASAALRVARLDLDAARGIVRDAAAPMLALPAADAPPVLGDLLGEVAGALASADSFNRWGEHFLRFVDAASLFEARFNFKDPGGLSFGGAAFASKLAALDAAFSRLPAPAPSLLPPALGVPAPRGAQAQAGVPVFTATVFADTFNNARGGCFALGCAIALPGGRATTVGAVRPGDVVATGLDGAGSARVVCLVDFAGPLKVVTLPGGPTLTPWHPVRPAGSPTWQFPARLAQPGCTIGTAPRVRSFVLEAGASCVLIDGMAACTLGHGLEDDDVIKHAFYGTRRVLDDLAAFPGWAAGHVTLTRDDEVYSEDGAILAYRPAPRATLHAAAGAPILLAA